VLIKSKKPLTTEEALGQQNEGMHVPELTQEQKKLLHEYRHDLGLAEQGLGLQAMLEPPEIWLREDTVKLNLGTYKNFSTRGWINIASPGEEKRDFHLPLDQLRLAPESANFIYAPFALETLKAPLQALRYWRDSLKCGGELAVVINDRDELIRLGRKFEAARFNGPELLRLLCEAGFDANKMLPINFRTFDLAGDDPAYRGYFAKK
jgi:hypothetical protein